MRRCRLLPPAGWPAWTFAVLLAAGAALRARAWAFAESFWIDEVLSARAVAGGPGGVLARIPRDKPPLDYWLQALSHPLGPPELSHRVPALASGIAAVALAYVLGRLAFNWRVGLVAMSLTALSGTMVYYSAEARPYMPLVALSFAQMASVAWLWRVRRRAHRGLLPAVALVIILSVALVWTMYSGFLVTGGEALFLACHAAWKWRSRSAGERSGARLHAALAACVAGIPALSIVPLLNRIDLVSKEGFPYVYGGDHLFAAAQALSGGLHMPSAVLAPVRGQVLVAAALLVLAMVPALASRDRRPLLFLPVVLAGIGMIAGYWVIDREFYPRYSLACAPATIVLASSGLCRLGRRLTAAWDAWVVPAAMVLPAVGLVPQEVRRPLRADWRGSMGEVARQAGRGETLVVPSHPEAICALYYLGRAGRPDIPVLVQADAVDISPAEPHWSLQMDFLAEGPTEKVRLDVRRIQAEPPRQAPGDWFAPDPEGRWSVSAGALPDGTVAGGWGHPEQWGETGASVRWAMRRGCFLYLPLGGSAGRLTLELFPYQFPDGAVQSVELAVDGQPLGRRDLPPGGFTATAWDVPGGTPDAHGWCLLELRFSRVRSPSEDRRNYADWRQLAAALGRVAWEPAHAR